MYINKFGLYEDIVDNLIKGHAYKNNDFFKRFYNIDKTVIAMDYTLPAGITMEEYFHDWIEITLVVEGEQQYIYCPYYVHYIILCLQYN